MASSSQPHTGTELEPFILQRLSDGRVWKIGDLYTAVAESGMLFESDYWKVPTTRGYEVLKALGYNRKDLSKAQLHALVVQHEIPAELSYRNAVRYALRQLKKEHRGADRVGSDQRATYYLISAGSSQPHQHFLDGALAAGPPSEDESSDPYLRSIREVRTRRGQQLFRDQMRLEFGDQCTITGCSVLALLEAAHIVPFSETQDQSPENGLLLRTDIHTLFDLDLIGIEPETGVVVVHPSIQDPLYRDLVGAKLSFGAPTGTRKARLVQRWQRFLVRVDQP